NTIGALDASGKEPLRKPYTPWLGRFLHAPPAYEYRCENPAHPDGCGEWHATELTRMIGSYGPETIAAFIAEPVAGATLGAAVPCDDYWPKIVEVCRAHGILVIAADRSEEHTSELQSRGHLVCRLLLEKKKKKQINKDMKKNHN